MPTTSSSERVARIVGVAVVSPATTCSTGSGATVIGWIGAGAGVVTTGGRVSGCWQAIQCVASSGLAAPHSSQKYSNDDCCIDIRVFFHSIVILCFIILNEAKLKNNST